MTQANYSYEDPCELEFIVYRSDGISKLGKFSFRGHLKGTNYFFQICSLFTLEMNYLERIEVDADGEDIVFKTFANVLRSNFYWEVRRGKAKTLEGVVRRHIEDLEQYKFLVRRLPPFLPITSADSLDYRRLNITIDRILEMIHEMRHCRINFYEFIFQQYSAKKDEYNQCLEEYLDNNRKRLVKEQNKFSVGSILSELGVEPVIHRKETYFGKRYEISYHAWFLKDLMGLNNPEIEKYTTGLPSYRFWEMNATPEGLKTFFELFSVFECEMTPILPKNLGEPLFKTVLKVLKRDFIDDFARDGSLETVLAENINELKKFEFLSLERELFCGKVVKMINSLRSHRIEFYKSVLEDYLANRERYDNVM